MIRSGHTFASKGTFPSLVALPTYPYYDFQDKVTGIEFIDSTLYTVVGRVAGGTREGNKKPALGLSKNNIGAASLIFKAEQGGGCYETNVQTNPATGEYTVNLPPLRYIITSDLHNSSLIVSNRSISFGVIDILDASVFLTPQTVIDTVSRDIIAKVALDVTTKRATIIVDGGTHQTNVPFEIIGYKATVPIEGSNYLIDLSKETGNIRSATLKLRTETKVSKVNFHLRRDFVYRSEPILSVTAADGNTFKGESSVSYKDPQTSISYVLDLKTNPFLYEVFQTNAEYTTKISLNETYTNKDNVLKEVTDLVPVSDASVIINNELSQEYPIELKMDSGICNYTFKGGVPSITANELEPKYSFTGVFQITGQVGPVGNAKYVNWKPLSTGDKYFRGYVLGTRMIEGTDFVSEGPQVVDFILRDPPGSESYASITKGTVISVAESFSMNTNQGGSVSTKAGFGMEINQVVGALGNGIEMTMSKSKFEGSLKIETDGSQTKSNEKVTTTTFMETFSTSASPDIAGSESDLYFGKAQNILFGIGNELLALPFSKVKNRTDIATTDTSKNGFTLALVKTLSVKPSDITTSFLYTQRHIATIVLPNLTSLRNGLLFYDPDYELVFTDMKDEKFGRNNDDFKWGNNRKKNDPLLTDDFWNDASKSDYSGPSYIWKPGGTVLSSRAGKTDKVRKYNEQIRIWKSTLARNENEKLNAEFEKNISFSAGAFYESSLTVNKSVSNSESWDVTISGDAGILINANVFGVDFENEIHFVAGYTQEQSGTTTSESETNVQFALSDPDIGDYFSVDVKKPKQFGGPVFYTQAGRSQCPWEELEVPKYIYDTICYFRLTKAIIDTIYKDLTPLNTPNSFLSTKMGGLIASLSVIKDRNYKTEVDFKKAVFNEIFGADYAKLNSSKLDYVSLFDAPYKIISVDAAYKPTTEKELGNLKLNEATIQREKPILNITPAIIDRVPANKPGVFTLTLGNEADEEGMYAIKIIESSNPYGAILKVDGSDIAGRIFKIPANSSIVKTLMVSKGSPDVNDYNLKIMIYSECDYQMYLSVRKLTIADTVTLAIHFVPACSDLEIYQPNDKFIVNYSNKTLNKNEYLYDVVINKYDINALGLQKIQLQYKPTSSSQWVGLQTWWKDTLDIPNGSNDKKLPSNLIDYKWDVSQLPDQNYELRSTSTCKVSDNYTLPITGLMDRVNPTPFGSPQPADGIMSAGDEVMIQFNEPIFSGGLTFSNFDLRGVLNGTKLRHVASLKLDGDESKYAVIPEGINFGGKSFSIEAWFKRTAKGEQCIISQGNATTNGLWLGFDVANKLTFNINGLAITTESDQLSSDIVPQWHHVVANFNSSTQVAQIILDGNLKKTATLNTEIKAAGRVILGKRNFDTPIPFNGNLQELRIWYDVRSLAKIYINMNLMLNGKERALAGNWRLDEAFGNMSRDYAASRNAILYNAGWKIDPSGDALNLSGNQSFLAINSADIAFGAEENFTIEFWFKGAGGANQCLFSNGKGDGTDSNPTGWSLTTDDKGKMIVASSGMSFKACDTSYFDNKWHHFALVVNRLANITAFFDGIRQGETSAENWAEFGGPKVYIGALANMLTGSTTFSNYFKGSIDEFRIWGMSRKQNQIQTTMNYMMEGTEPGLMLYLPFEKYTDNMGILMSVASYQDISTGKHVTTSTGSSFTGINASAAIKLPRPLSKVNFKWVTNVDKILLDITDPDPLIENCILDVVVKDVKDLNGNIMQNHDRPSGHN